MDNLNQPLESSEQVNQNTAPWSLIIFIILVVIAIGFAWQFTGDKHEPIVIEEPIPLIKETPIAVEVTPEPIPEVISEKPEPTVVEDVIEPVKEPLPLLDNSDNWLKLKLPEITWRKELLKLIIDEDMIRRFVVFTDNFAQGIIAYEHSPFTSPKGKFTVVAKSSSSQEILQTETDEPIRSKLPIKQDTWQWSDTSSKRFNLYVDLLRSIDSESLVNWYSEIKPLIDEAYNELGYEDNFTNTLQDAITRVLDMELPKSSMELIQPSVMYKFADPELEALPDSDKLLLRIGKENLLVMKAILLELHEKLAQLENGVH